MNAGLMLTDHPSVVTVYLLEFHITEIHITEIMWPKIDSPIFTSPNDQFTECSLDRP